MPAPHLTPAKPLRKMRMWVTLAEYRALPAEDRQDPAVEWCINLTPEKDKPERDYAGVFSGSAFHGEGWEYDR